MTPFIIASAPVEKRGLVSGIYNTMRFTGATVGIALLGAIYTNSFQNQQQLIISSEYKDLSPRAKVEWTQIAKKQVTVSKEGLDVNKIHAAVRQSAYSALYLISLISLFFSTVGFILVFIEQVTRKIDKNEVSL
jgi:hypothetical protein